MGLTAVRPGRLCDEVVAQFEALIASGEWAVGAKIPPEPAARTSLERDAAVAAALHRTDADVVAIRAAVEARRAACDAPDRARFVAADVAFHKAVVAATANPVLIDLYAGLTEALQRTV